MFTAEMSEVGRIDTLTTRPLPRRKLSDGFGRCCHVVCFRSDRPLWAESECDVEKGGKWTLSILDATTPE